MIPEGNPMATTVCNGPKLFDRNRSETYTRSAIQSKDTTKIPGRLLDDPRRESNGYHCVQWPKAFRQKAQRNLHSQRYPKQGYNKNTWEATSLTLAQLEARGRKEEGSRESATLRPCHEQPGHNLEEKIVYTSRFVRVILAHGAMLIFSVSFQF